MKICFILGTRPEIIKLSPLIRECIKRHLLFFIIHTNQHYSETMDNIFFRELNLPNPKYNLNIGSDSHGAQTGKMLMGIEKILEKESPHVVFVQGDTNSVLAGALAASKMQKTLLAHVESGLRSYDRTMPEEVNRIITDHISNILLAPTTIQKKNLIREGISQKNVYIVGNTIVDAIFQNLKEVKKHAQAFKNLEIVPKKYAMLTMHRPSNVESKENLTEILDSVKIIIKQRNIPIIFPVHPRTKKMLEYFRLNIPMGLRLIEPIGYLEMLQIIKNALFVLTDSGGIQEEACILRVPCITLRRNTERPETIEVGGNILAGQKKSSIVSSVNMMLKRKANWRNPFGDGKSGEKIIKIITFLCRPTKN